MTLPDLRAAFYKRFNISVEANLSISAIESNGLNYELDDDSFDDVAACVASSPKSIVDTPQLVVFAVQPKRLHSQPSSSASALAAKVPVPAEMSAAAKASQSAAEPPFNASITSTLHDKIEPPKRSAEESSAGGKSSKKRKLKKKKTASLICVLESSACQSASIRTSYYCN